MSFLSASPNRTLLACKQNGGRLASSRQGTVMVQAYRHSGELRQIQEKKLKSILRTYNKAQAFYPKVKFVMKHNSRLGEVWKLTGNAAELGAWCPEVSPTLCWKEGGIWSAEVALPPGTYTFKCLLRKADGSYIWENGENRHLVVPIKERAGPLVMTYHMDVRTEPVESLFKPGKYGVMKQSEQQDTVPLFMPEQSNGRRVLAGAGAY